MQFKSCMYAFVKTCLALWPCQSAPAAVRQKSSAEFSNMHGRKLKWCLVNKVMKTCLRLNLHSSLLHVSHARVL